MKVFFSELLPVTAACCFFQESPLSDLCFLNHSAETLIMFRSTSGPIKTRQLLHPGVLLPVCRRQCECQHNTCGESCDRCCPGFNQKPWRAATVDSPNECQRKCSRSLSASPPCAALQIKALTAGSCRPSELDSGCPHMVLEGNIPQVTCDEKHCTAGCRIVTYVSRTPAAGSSTQWTFSISFHSCVFCTFKSQMNSSDGAPPPKLLLHFHF